MKITKKQIVTFAVLMATLVGAVTCAQSASAAEVDVYRLYNKVSHEHLYTASKHEYDTLPTKSRDWVREGVNFREYSTASASTKAVNRVYNPKSGEHIYTQDSNEVKVLTGKHGWKSEGVAFHAPKTSSNPVYRVFNAGAGLGAHFVTGDTYEKNSLVSRGWKYEGIACYAIENTPSQTKYTVWYNGDTTTKYNIKKGDKLFSTREQAQSWITNYARQVLIDHNVTAHDYGTATW